MWPLASKGQEPLI